MGLHLLLPIDVSISNGSKAGFFCTKPENSVPDFQKLRSQKSRKTQFLPKNSVPNVSKPGVFMEIFSQNQPKNFDFCPKTPNFSENSTPKPQKLSFQ